MLKKSSLPLGWKFRRAKDRMILHRWVTDNCLVLSMVYWKIEGGKSRGLGVFYTSTDGKRRKASAKDTSSPVARWENTSERSFSASLGFYPGTREI